LTHKRDGPVPVATARPEAESDNPSFLPLFTSKQAPQIPSVELQQNSPEPIRIIVDGLAVAKGRARATRKGFVYTPAATRKYEAYARLAASEAMNGRPPLHGPVRLDLLVELPIPASWSQKKRLTAIAGLIKPTTRPDLDNYVKSALDAINTIVIADDSQIIELRASKRFSEQPKLIATVFSISGKSHGARSPNG
jgi:Holliday junction resolvase RusA-like endonuclease